MSKNVIQQFEEYLSKQGLRFTGQRQLIAHAFFRNKGHISSEELYRQVQQTTPNIGLTTVYRTLKLLSEAGLASGKNFRDGYARFEPTSMRAHHDHLVCTECGKIIEFFNDQIETLQQNIARRHGFSLVDHSLDIYGICRDCRKK